VRVTVHTFNPERDIFSRHPLEIDGTVPHTGLVSWILREIGRTGYGSRPVDWREESQVPARVVYLAAADRDNHEVFTKPGAVIKHKSEERLLWTTGTIVRTSDSAAVFASCIARERKCHLRNAGAIRPVKVSHFNAVVCVDALAAWIKDSVCAVT